MPPSRKLTFAKVGNLHLQRRGCPGGPLPLDAEPLWGLNPKWTAGGRTAGPQPHSEPGLPGWPGWSYEVAHGGI
jgi:hypothetical protein